MNTFFATILPCRLESAPGIIKKMAATKNPSVPKATPAVKASSTSEFNRPRSGSKLDGMVQSNESCEADTVPVTAIISIMLLVQTFRH